jgi:hypothetical protein
MSENQWIIKRQKEKAWEKPQAFSRFATGSISRILFLLSFADIRIALHDTAPRFPQATIIYLGRLLPNASSGTSGKAKSLRWEELLALPDTALHRSKDLAVSFVRHRTPVLA